MNTSEHVRLARQRAKRARHINEDLEAYGLHLYHAGDGWVLGAWLGGGHSDHPCDRLMDAVEGWIAERTA